MKVKSESEATQSCLTLRDLMDCSPPGSSIHGIFQARVLEWGAIAFSVTFVRVAISCNQKSLDYYPMSERGMNDCYLFVLFTASSTFRAQRGLDTQEMFAALTNRSL